MTYKITVKNSKGKSVEVEVDDRTAFGIAFGINQRIKSYLDQNGKPYKDETTVVEQMDNVVEAIHPKLRRGKES